MEESLRHHDSGLVELALQAHEGSPQAWEKLFQTVEMVVRRRCRLEKPKILKFRLRDSDIVQEVAIKTHQSLGEFRGKTEQEFIVWLTVITQNLIDDYYRKYQSSKNRVGNEISLESLEQMGEKLPARQDEAEVDKQKYAKSLDVLARLPDRYFWAIELHMEEGLTFQEIGTKLHCTKEAARKLYHRGVERIQEKLKERN